MASNLYQTGGDEDINETGAATQVPVGNPRVNRRNQILHQGLDYVPFNSQPVAFSATASSAMSDKQASAWLHRIIAKAGMEGEAAENVVAFLHAICLCHALNSASQLVPERATFNVAGTEFNWRSVVVETLGDDLRRFFRAYADTTHEVLKDVLIADEHGDPEAQRVVRDLRVIAANRGLSDVTLAFDTAEYMTELSPTQRAVINTSKKLVIDAAGPSLVNNPLFSRPAGGGSLPVAKGAPVSPTPEWYQG